MDHCQFAWQDTEKRDTFFLTIEGQALDPRPAAASTDGRSMTTMKSPPPVRPGRKEKVAHIRFSLGEFAALEAEAERAGLTVSAFVRSLSLEGAGVYPFLSEADRAIIELLGQGMWSIGNNLNQLARAINAGGTVAASEVLGRINDARAIATTVAAELANMTRRASAERRGEAA